MAVGPIEPGDTEIGFDWEMKKAWRKIGAGKKQFCITMTCDESKDHPLATFVETEDPVEIRDLTCKEYIELISGGMQTDDAPDAKELLEERSGDHAEMQAEPDDAQKRPRNIAD